MSAPGEQTSPPREAEKLPIGRIVAIGVTALFVFTAGCVWVYRVTATRRAELGGVPTWAPQMGQPQVGLVDQRMFQLERGAAELRRSQQERLGGYGWVDRQRNRIHVPIERALELTVQAGGTP